MTQAEKDKQLSEIHGEIAKVSATIQTEKSKRAELKAKYRQLKAAPVDPTLETPKPA